MKRLEQLVLCAALVCVLLASLRVATPRPALGEDETPVEKQDNPIAVCDVWFLTYTLAMSDRYAGRRAEYEKLGDALTPMGEKLDQLRKSAEALDPNDEQVGAKRDEYMELYDQYKDKYDEFNEVQDRVFGEVVADARKLVVESARAVALELGYTYVIASSPNERLDERDKDQPKSYRSAWQRHLGDQVVLFPEGADITEDVRDDLKLD